MHSASVQLSCRPSRRCAARTTSTAVLRATAVGWRRGRARRRTRARSPFPSLRGGCCPPGPEVPAASCRVAARGNPTVPREAPAVQHQPPSGPAAPRRGYVQPPVVVKADAKTLLSWLTRLTPDRPCAARTTSTAVLRDSPATRSPEAASRACPPGMPGSTGPSGVDFKTRSKQQTL